MRRKLNKNYVSFFNYFCGEEEIACVPEGYGYRYHDGIDDWPYIYTPGFIPVSNSGPEGNFYYLHQLSGMLQPLVKMKKDLTDTFEPYYTLKKHTKDCLQPINGVKNILSGVCNLLVGVTFITIEVAFLPLSLCSLEDRLEWLSSVIYPLTWIVRGVLDIFRGITQLIFTPLVYLIKIPLRWLITNHKRQTCDIIKAEMKPEIKRLATKAQYYLNEMKNTKEKLVIEKKADSSEEDKLAKDHIESIHKPMRILYEINRKFNRSVSDGWKSNLDADKLEEKYNNIYRLYSLYKGFITVFPQSMFKKNQDKKDVDIKNDDKYSDFIETASVYLANF